MIDILFHLKKKEKPNPGRENLVNHYRSFYKDPLVTESRLGNAYILSVSKHGTKEFVKPVYSKETNTHIWIVGTVFIAEIEVVRIYNTFGIDGFKDVSGWFNILTFSETTTKVELINSKFGMDLINYSINSDEIIIANRLSIFYKLKKDIATDRAIVLQQSLYNYPFSNKTHLKGVLMLPSAHTLTIEGNNEKLEQYWRVQDELVEKPLGFRKSVNLLDETLDKVIKRQVQNQDKIGVSLTGGWDGRLLLAYALKHIDKEKVTLYSFGVKEAPDVIIPLEVSKKLGFNYHPIYLDSNYLKNDYLTYAAKTVLYSDSLRSIKRAHYLYAMDYLGQHLDVILTGVAGSNLLKSTSYAPCNVFNKFVLNLIKADDRKLELKNQLDYVHNTFGNLFKDVQLDDFVESFNLDDLNSILAIKNPNERFCTFLISNIERKYFGAEMASYKHLVTNYSPFLDYDFISALVKTSFFGGYNDGKKYISTFNNSMLYAKLITRNSPELAAEPTDRGFSMEQMANPMKYGSLIVDYLKAKSKVKAQTSGDYNTEFAVRAFNEHFGMGLDELTKLEPLNKEFVANYLSFSWYSKEMNKQKV
jgi:hypothetical protein